MKSFDISDKKIFLGLVILISLTIALIIGITFIQRPQTTTSEAGTTLPNEPSGLIDKQEPTSIPLPGLNDEEAEDETTEETVTPDAPTITTTPSSPTIADPTGAPNDGTTSTSETLSEPTATPTTAPTTTPSGSEPTPTDTIIADSGPGDGDGEDIVVTYPTSGQVPTSSYSYTTSTPVPTVSNTLPVAGAVHITLLIFAASFLLVVLGLAL